MRNPLRSETDAFRFVLLTIAYFALIVIGSVIDVWLGVAVFVVLTVGAVWWIMSSRRASPPPVRQAPAPSPQGEHRLLVVANETVDGPELRQELERRASGGRLQVLVVAPALTQPLQQWLSDEDDARAAAQARLNQVLASLRSLGVEARGEVGAADPVQAVEDALRTFRPDELILATHPAGRSAWLEEGVVEKVRERYALPLTHVVVDRDVDSR
jgi:GABA permease